MIRGISSGSISIRFEVVKRSTRKSGKCVKCGKRCTRSRTEEGTINPFNRNPDGSIRSREEIGRDLDAKLSEWLKEPIMHASCEE